MKAAIRHEALQLGFDECRFTTACAPKSAPRFQEWLREGFHGAMAYLERNAQKRIEPHLVLADAASVISLAVRYSGDNASTTGANSMQPQAGIIARYARYRDYHDVVAPRLQNLSEVVNRIGGTGTRSLWYVDTGPLLERALAQRAGLGFIGKHTNLISRSLGNWFFLAEIITTLRLEPDAPETNRCGTCTRCITACPTSAIVAPFRLDARRCISYLTIELKGSIPVELRPAIGNRIFGCDDCLAVCPWNRFAREGGLMREHARTDLDVPDLCKLLSLDEAAFKARFAGTPLLRTQRRRFLRNVCVALGNVGDGLALPALERAASDPEPLIAEHACWAIDRILARCHPQLQSIERDATGDQLRE
jgi:epoxyqueuosine reductase